MAMNNFCLILLLGLEIDTKENDPKKAKEIVEEMCKKLLANLIIEDYKVSKI